MPIDPDVVPELDKKADKTFVDQLMSEVNALKVAGVKAHVHTEYAASGHSHTGTPIPTPVPIPTPTPTPPTPPTLPELPGEIPAGTDVNASELVAKLAAAPNGAVFRVRPGTAGGTLTLKPGQQVWGLDPANRPLFDGGGAQWFARGAGSSADVELGYLRFKNYVPANSTWVNVAGDSFRRYGGINGDELPNSRLYRLEGFDNGLAIRAGNDMEIVECHLHHNHQWCVNGWRKTGIKVLGGEWHDNNRRPDGRPWFDWGWEAGNKFVECTNALIEGLFSHHNIGPGIWPDISNDRFVIRKNRTEDNVGPGIFWEVSHQATIEDNDSHRNGNAANIYISNSRGKSAADPIRVRNNRTSGHRQWEIGMQNDNNRQPPPSVVLMLDFVEVSNNVVVAGSGVAPIRLHTIGSPPVPTSIVVTGNKTPAGVAVGLTRSP